MVDTTVLKWRLLGWQNPFYRGTSTRERVAYTRFWAFELEHIATVLEADTVQASQVLATDIRAMLQELEKVGQK